MLLNLNIILFSETQINKLVSFSNNFSTSNKTFAGTLAENIGTAGKSISLRAKRALSVAVATNLLSEPCKLTAVKIGRCSLVDAANAVWSTIVLNWSTVKTKDVPFSCKSISGYSSGLIEFNLKLERKSEIWAIVSSITSNEITSPSIFLTISVKYLLATKVEPSSLSLIILLSSIKLGISVLIEISLYKFT